MRPGIREFGRISQSIRGISYGARSIETQIATYVVRVWRCRSARCGSGCTRGSICRARAGGHILAGQTAFEIAAELGHAIMVDAVGRSP